MKKTEFIHQCIINRSTLGDSPRSIVSQVRQLADYVDTKFPFDIDSSGKTMDELYMEQNRKWMQSRLRSKT